MVVPCFSMKLGTQEPEVATGQKTKSNIAKLKSSSVVYVVCGCMSLCVYVKILHQLCVI